MVSLETDAIRPRLEMTSRVPEFPLDQHLVEPEMLRQPEREPAGPRLGVGRPERDPVIVPAEVDRHEARRERDDVAADLGEALLR